MYLCTLMAAPIHHVLPHLLQYSPLFRGVSTQTDSRQEKNSCCLLFIISCLDPYLSIKSNVCCNFYYCHRQPFIVKTSSEQQFLATFHTAIGYNIYQIKWHISQSQHCPTSHQDIPLVVRSISNFNSVAIFVKLPVFLTLFAKICQRS